MDRKSVAQEIDRLDVAVKTLAGDRFRAIVRDIGNLAEILAFLEFGDVDLDRRDVDCLERVEQCDGRVGVRAGVDDDSVDLIKICLLDVIDQSALVVALKALYFDALVRAVGFDHLHEVVVSVRAVDRGFSDAEHVKVWSVKYKYLHFSVPRMSAIALS